MEGEVSDDVFLNVLLFVIGVIFAIGGGRIAFMSLKGSRGGFQVAFVGLFGMVVGLYLTISAIFGIPRY